MGSEKPVKPRWAPKYDRLISLVPNGTCRTLKPGLPWSDGRPRMVPWLLASGF